MNRFHDNSLYKIRIEPRIEDLNPNMAQAYKDLGLFAGFSYVCLGVVQPNDESLALVNSEGRIVFVPWDEHLVEQVI